ncbi:hypothetical protein IVB22_10355 [Bradyrhizobium sp. 190]|nr:hypothetical protein [Bradyrhizobium sp. 190]
MQYDNSFSMVRALVRSRHACHSKISVWVSLQSEFSNDQVENSFQSDCGTDAMSDQRILRWRFAVCEVVYIRSERFLAGMSLVGTFRTSQAMAAVSVVEGKRTTAGRCSISANTPETDVTVPFRYRDLGCYDGLREGQRPCTVVVTKTADVGWPKMQFIFDLIWQSRGNHLADIGQQEAQP